MPQFTLQTRLAIYSQIKYIKIDKASLLRWHECANINKIVFTSFDTFQSNIILTSLLFDIRISHFYFCATKIISIMEGFRKQKR